MRLVQWRVHRLLSLRELAKLSNLTVRTVHNTEMGYSLPTMKTIRRLSEALDLEPSFVDEFQVTLRNTVNGRT